jgi:hypothetical protein
MTKKWIAIDLLLLAVAALLGWELRVSILQFNAENDLAKIQPARDMKQKVLQDKPVPKVVSVKNYNPAEFAVIPDKNIFSDTRSKEDKTETLTPPEPPPLAQKPILVGVTIDTQPRASIIINPTAPQGRDRRAQIKRIGDVYQGYTITEITPERIVLENGTRKEIIPLHEGSKRGPQGKTPILSTRVAPIGGGSVTGGTLINATAGSAAAPPRTAVAPVGTPAAASSGQTATPAAPAAQQAQPAQTPATGTAPKPQGIRTPFGDIYYPRPE